MDVLPIGERPRRLGIGLPPARVAVWPMARNPAWTTPLRSRGSAGTLLLRANGSARLDDSTLRISAPWVTLGSWTVLRRGLGVAGRFFLIRWTTREEGDGYP